jgi:HAD superfamily hydrolase (TIGR01549 family)
MLKAVLFDLDDTLIDWSQINNGEWDDLQLNQLYGVFDYLCECHPLEGRQDFIQEFRTRSMQAWMSAQDNLIAPNVSKVLLDTALALGVPQDRVSAQPLMEAYRLGVITSAELFPEVKDVLSDLRDSGLQLGIVTNAYQPMWVRDIELEAFGLTEFFPECRLSAADHGYLKPHRSIFEAALKCLGIQPEEAVFVGDNLEADIAGAQGAGIHGVLRILKHRPVLLDGTIEPDSMLNSLTELPAILDQYFPGWNQ